MTGRSLGHRAPLLWLVLPLIAGLMLGRTFEITVAGWLLGIALAAAGVALRCALTGNRGWEVTVLIGMLCAGGAAYALQRARLRQWEALPPREVLLTLRIDRLFASSGPTRASGLATVLEAESHLHDLRGQRLYFSLTLRRGEPLPVRTSVVSVIGVLVTLPAKPPARSFDHYLTGAGMNFRLTRGQVQAEVVPGSAYHRFCARMATRAKHILGLGIEPKRPALAGLLRAMMLGATNEMTDEQQTLFMQSGTMHLFAISGLNIAVIAGTIQSFLLLLRLRPWFRFLIGTAILWLFVDVTGAAPSAVRAFVMATFVQAAFVLRRPANSLAAVTASALAVLLVSPLQVFSASFLMSYGIVVALLVLGLPLGEAWVAHWRPWRDVPPITWNFAQKAIAAGWRGLLTTLAIGVATTLMSLLTSVEFFGLLTPGALAANLVLIPAAIATTVAGFVSLICGLVGFAPGAVWCNHAAALVLLVIEWLVRVSVGVPGTFLPAHFDPEWLGATAIAVLVGALLAGYAGHWERRRGGWWPPFLLVLVVLAFGVAYD